jgi:hypothetical protein
MPSSAAPERFPRRATRHSCNALRATLLADTRAASYDEIPCIRMQFLAVGSGLAIMLALGEYFAGGALLEATLQCGPVDLRIGLSGVAKAPAHSERRKFSRSCFWAVVSSLNLPITPFASEPGL